MSEFEFLKAEFYLDGVLCLLSLSDPDIDVDKKTLIFETVRMNKCLDAEYITNKFTVKLYEKGSDISSVKITDVDLITLGQLSVFKGYVIASKVKFSFGDILSE